MPKEIVLTYGRKTIVDEIDYDMLIQYTWYAHRERGRWMAARRDHEGNVIYMHEQIAQPEEGWGVRHKEPYQTLNNRRSNLVRYRIETSRQSLRRPYRGVEATGKKYFARIRMDGKRITLGSFNNARDAAIAYDQAAYRKHGRRYLSVASFREELLAAIEAGRI